MGLDSDIFAIRKGEKPDGDWDNINQLWYGGKANAIHNWFVVNVQNGEDNCEDNKISREQFEKLFDTLNKIMELYDAPELQSLPEDDRMDKIKDECAKLLPTKAGYFFGCIDYDYFYIYEVKNLRDTLKILLSSSDFDRYDYYYSSSW